MIKTVEAKNFSKRPGWINLLNGVWKTGYVLGAEPKLDKDKLIRLARRETGLNDLARTFGRSRWRNCCSL